MAIAAPPTPAVVEAETLFRRHAVFVAAFLRQLGASRADAEDLVQEVFMVAHQKGGFVPGQAKPTTWLGAIAFRRYQNFRRRRVNRDESRPSESFDASAADQASPLQLAENREAMRRLDTVLARLTEEQRAVFMLREVEGDTCVAIGEALGIPVGTVYSRLHEARKRVRAFYAELVPDSEEG